MKKIYYLISLFILSGFMAKSQCSLDSSNMQIGFFPADTSIHPIIQGVPYDTFAQFYLPAFVNDTTDTLQILSAEIDTIFGLPTGITYVQSPASHTISPDGRVCFSFTGRTVDTVGWYNFSFLGAIHVISAALGDTLLSLTDFNSVIVAHYESAAPFQYALLVQSPYVRPCMDIDTVYDTTVLINPGVYPVPSDLPCIVQGVPYNQTVQGRIQTDSTITIDGINAQVTIDSMQLDSILGLPTGITFGRSPQILLGGGYGCVNFAGTTTDTTGTYALTAYGNVWLTINAAGQKVPYMLRGALNDHSPFGGYYLRVVNSSDSCSLTIPTTGIKQYYNSLNAEISVIPNPNNGVFNLKINAASPVTGQIQVYDGIGRKLYEQPIDIIGLYTTTLDMSRFASGIYFLQVRTPQGVGTKKISIE